MPQGDTISIKYAALCSVKLLHHYFLDRRTDLFDNIEENGKLKLLAGYDARRVFTITPTPATESNLAGRGWLFKPHLLGFTIVSLGDPEQPVPADQQLQANEQLTFSIKLADSYFLQYTSGFQKMEEVRVEKATEIGKPDRFFKKMMVFDNGQSALYPFLGKGPTVHDTVNAYQPEAVVKVTGADGMVEFHQAKKAVAANLALSGANWNKLPRREYPDYENAKSYKLGDFVKSGSEYFEAVADVPANKPPGPANIAFWQKTTDLSAYFASPSDMLELELGPETPGDAFGLVVIRGGKALGKFSLYSSDDKQRSPQYELRFQNRWTWWHYFDALGEPSAIPDGFFPLTQNGKAAGRESVPNPDGRSALRRLPTSKSQPLAQLFNDIYL